MNQQPLPIVIPRGGGTGSCSGGVRRQHCAGAPGGKPIVAQTDGAHTGASSAFAPAEHARKGHRPDGDGWVSPSDVYSPYYKNVAASDFDILPGGVAFTKHYTENTSFDYPNKAASLSFRYLDHPLVAHLVPYIRRPCRRTTVSPAYLAAIVRRALPIFEIHFKNYPSIPRSPLLSQFISALYSLSKLLPDELAAEVKRLVQPDLHATNIQLPITFELPTFPCLPRNTPSETYEYSDDERLAMSPFNDPVFKHIFPFWRHPEIILETDPDHIPALLARFRLGLSAFLPIVNRLNAMSQSFPPIVTAAIRNTAQAVQMFPPDGETYSWLVKLPDIWEHEDLEFPELAFPLSESVKFPPDWQPLPTDPSPSESISSMFSLETLDAPKQDINSMSHIYSQDDGTDFDTTSRKVMPHSDDPITAVRIDGRADSTSMDKERTQNPSPAVHDRNYERAASETNEALAPIAGGTLAHTRLPLKGDQPSLNDWESFVIDHHRERLYSYGGVRPYDKSITPTSDFHCLDLRTMEWKNIGPLLRFCPVAHPSLIGDTQLNLKELPALMEPANALISVCDRTYMFLFGGHDPGSQRTTADLIAIDLDSFIWWYADVGGTPILPRMSASMIALRNQLFIFGGRREDDDSCPGIGTYSIAVYDPHTQWTWTVSDAPIPVNICPLGYGIQATPIADGEMILLTRGWVENTEPCTLSPDTIILFHTKNFTFRTASETTGNFPTGIRWHLLGSMFRGGSPLQSRPVFPPSVVIVAWVRHTETEDVLVPEIWQYFPPPVHRIRCLDLRETFWDLNLDLQSFVALGNRMLLFGSEEGHDDEADLQDDALPTDRALPRWDTAIEVSARHLVE